MIRTVWLAAACLGVLGAMAAGKVAKAPAAQTTDEQLVVGTTVDADFAREPLIKADRLEVIYARQEKQSQSALQPIVPEVQKTIARTETSIVSRHWHDPNAIGSSAANSKRTATKGKSAADFSNSQAARSLQAKRAD